MLEQRIEQHFIDSADLKYQAAQILSKPIAQAIGAILASVTSGGKVLACGNGGSAADAQHFAAEFVGRFERERPELGAIALDSDDYYWLPTQPPFTDRRDRALRHQLVMADLEQHPRAILSGAIIGWGDDLEHAFDLVIFLSLPHDLRVSRLRARELARYGRINEPFIAWAAGYDDDPPTSPTRNRRRQHEWLGERRCPVLRLEGDLTVAERVTRTLAQLSPVTRW